jgi:hypothetical protein
MMRELTGLDAQRLSPALLQGAQPLVLRGLVSAWPAVRAADAPGGIIDYLRPRDVGAMVQAWFAPAQAEGRFFYTDDLTGFNFAREPLRLAAFLDLLQRHRDEPHAPAIYTGAAAVEALMPAFRADNDLAPALLEALQPLASAWLGNRTCIAAHQDVPDNLACVVAGRRRFTLLPPDQVRNLYVGPLEHTPAGQPISLVDLRRPDLARFPRFAQALPHLQVAELGPGDAIFIPSLWWHHVESLEPMNLLVNYWWRRTPLHMDSPVGALLHAIMTVRDLPPEQRAAWRSLFDHYVFDADEQTAAHIPPAARDVLAPMDERTARGLRARLIRRLNR